METSEIGDKREKYFEKKEGKREVKNNLRGKEIFKL